MHSDRRLPAKLPAPRGNAAARIVALTGGDPTSAETEDTDGMERTQGDHVSQPDTTVSVREIDGDSTTSEIVPLARETGPQAG